MSISIHALRGEGDRIPSPSGSQWANFYPRPPRGGRRCRVIWVQSLLEFLSTPSAGRATWQLSCTGNVTYDFYPRPPRGGRLLVGRRCCVVSAISIHALRGEGDRWTHRAIVRSFKFLSTPSAGRATSSRNTGRLPRKISIHALRGEGDGGAQAQRAGPRDFYPRPPRGGRPVYARGVP